MSPVSSTTPMEVEICASRFTRVNRIKGAYRSLLLFLSFLRLSVSLCNRIVFSKSIRKTYPVSATTAFAMTLFPCQVLVIRKVSGV